ncbi:DUF192 domain-containing protein [Mesorhizobium sp. VNQ89]|uniref:DUF192 domain-containing protein n=1 Tax=Mesorhizobium quangtriensis TaxID=3157709 RepID=UPI0032B83F64
MMRKILLAAAGVVVILAVAGFYVFYYGMQPTSADQAMHLPVDPVSLVIETASGEKSFTIEIADDQNERSRGLMFRETMDDDHGMLFVFPETKPVGFWMKNTPMPLDLIFVGQDGRVIDILPGEPFSEALIAPADPARFVLELKRGTAEKSGIADGDFLRHPAVNEAPGAANPG